MQLSRNIINFLPGEAPRIDIYVANPDDETLYVEVEVLEVRNPGTEEETRTPVKNPSQVDFLVTPNKFIVPPGNRKLVRFVNIGGHAEEERIFRINLVPKSPPMEATQNAIRLVVGYQVLALIAPAEETQDLKVYRDGTSVTVANQGKASVLFRNGVQCETEEDLLDRPDERCSGLEPRRIYPGNVWEFDLPYDAPFEFMLSESGRLRREQF
jgi:P pilus assembly chaperone PapD